jgi:hypothetical protein
MAASGVAPTMSTSSLADRPSSQARARRIRRSFAVETIAFALICRMSQRLGSLGYHATRFAHSRVADHVAAHERFHLPDQRAIGLFDHRLVNARTPSGLAMPDNAKLFMRTVAFPPKPVLARDAPIRPAGAISGRSTQRAAKPTASHGMGRGHRYQQHHGAVHAGIVAGLAQVCPGRSGRDGAGNNRPSFHARFTRECAQSVSFRPFQHDA